MKEEELAIQISQTLNGLCPAFRRDPTKGTCE